MGPHSMNPKETDVGPCIDSLSKWGNFKFKFIILNGKVEFVSRRVS